MYPRTTIVVSVAMTLLMLVATSQAHADPWIQWSGNGHYYQAVSAPAGISWFAAQADAVSKGGYLATIASAEENDFVFSLIDAPEYWIFYADGWTSGPWLGGYQPEGSPEPDGGWTWVTGEPWGYTHWSAWLDDDHGGEDYLQFTAGRQSTPMRGKLWNDIQPDSTTWPVGGYVIESPVPEPATLLLLAGGSLLAIYRRGSIAGRH